MNGNGLYWPEIEKKISLEFADSLVWRKNSNGKKNYIIFYNVEEMSNKKLNIVLIEKIQRKKLKGRENLKGKTLNAEKILNVKKMDKKIK